VAPKIAPPREVFRKRCARILELPRDTAQRF
jgi:hypothetical protein